MISSQNEKVEDRPFKERWPTLYSLRVNWIIKLSLPVFAIWTIYIGVNIWINHALGWPMNQPLVPDMSYQAYQQYVQNQQQGEAILGPLMGSMFILIGVWFGYKVSKVFYRKREVEEEL